LSLILTVFTAFTFNDLTEVLENDFSRIIISSIKELITFPFTEEYLASDFAIISHLLGQKTASLGSFS
jgi:hypothetical protein